jgi:glycosyltransferase involved in cell wall biosynthesis
MRKRVLLATATLGTAGGGVGVVAEQMHGALARHAELDHCRYEPNQSLASRLSFAGRLALSNVRANSALYAHLDLARALKFYPRRAPFAVFLHSLEAWKPLDASRVWALRHARVLLANSQYTLDRMAEFHPHVAPTQVVHLGVDFTRSRLPNQTERVANRVLIVGRMVAAERNKGHDQLIEAWPGIQAKLPDAELICLGAGDDVQRLRDKASQLRANVKFLSGLRDHERDQLLQSSALFAFPSIQEGFGLAPVEAAGFATPVLAVPGTSVAEVFGPHAHYVPAMEAGLLQNAIIQLLQSPHRLVELGALGQAHVYRHYSLAAFETRLLGVLKEFDLI